MFMQQINRCSQFPLTGHQIAFGQRLRTSLTQLHIELSVTLCQTIFFLLTLGIHKTHFNFHWRDGTTIRGFDRLNLQLLVLPTFSKTTSISPEQLLHQPFQEKLNAKRDLRATLSCVLRRCIEQRECNCTSTKCWSGGAKLKIHSISTQSKHPELRLKVISSILRTCQQLMVLEKSQVQRILNSSVVPCQVLHISMLELNGISKYHQTLAQYSSSSQITT